MDNPHSPSTAREMEAPIRDMITLFPRYFKEQGSLAFVSERRLDVTPILLNARLSCGTTDFVGEGGCYGWKRYLLGFKLAPAHG